MIAIIDYDVGNLKNVYTALKDVGLEGVITRDPRVVDNAEAIILPGVGAFSDAMDHLRQFDLIDCLNKMCSPAKPSWVSAWACRFCLIKATRTASGQVSAIFPERSSSLTRRGSKFRTWAGTISSSTAMIPWSWVSAARISSTLSIPITHSQKF